MGGGGFTELQSYCPYLDDLSKGVGPFPGEATAGQIDGADGCLVLNALTKHCKGKQFHIKNKNNDMYSYVLTTNQLASSLDPFPIFHFSFFFPSVFFPISDKKKKN